MTKSAVKRVVVFGPGPKFKGGLANYTVSLARAFDKAGIETHLLSWTQQYPAIIPRDFIDRASREDKMAGTNIKVQYITNYNNPGTWWATVDAIKSLKPDLVVFQWSVAVQGLPLGAMARRLKKAHGIEVCFDLHFVIQKEQSAIDRWFSKYGIGVADSYVVHSYKTAEELKELLPNHKFEINETGTRTQTAGAHTVIKLYHPVYDMFKPNPTLDLAATKDALHLRENVFLFFGFIRKYKGLHHCIEAMARVVKQRQDVSLLIVGESFWQTLDNTKLSTKIKQGVFGLVKKVLLSKQSDEKDYRPLELIKKYGLEDYCTVVNDFVPNEEVHRYFQVSDAILLYYEYATPSGVESMAYNFKTPVLAAKVGHFPETIKHGVNGYLAEAEDHDSMAQQMLKFLDAPISRDEVDAMARQFSWDNYAAAILNR